MGCNSLFSDDMYGDFEDLETGEKSTGKFENDSDDVDSNAGERSFYTFTYFSLKFC